MAVQFGALTFEERWRISALAARFRLSAIYAIRERRSRWASLLYGPLIRYNFERAAVPVDKNLRCASPADLPFEQPTKFEQVIKLKTAKALGLTIPQQFSCAPTR